MKKAARKTRSSGSGHRRCVEKHPLYGEIRELALQRFSSQSIVRLLKWQHFSRFESGELPPLMCARTVQRWASTLPTKDLLPMRKLTEKLGEIERNVAVFDQLQELYHVAEDRVVRVLTFEETMQVPIPGTDRAIETLLKVGQQLWQVGQDLGVYPRQDGGTFVRMETDGGGRSSFVLQLGMGPPRVLDMKNLDLSTLSEDELEALKGMGDIVDLPVQQLEGGRNT